jgi:hypothetical protein
MSSESLDRFLLNHTYAYYKITEVFPRKTFTCLYLLKLTIYLRAYFKPCLSVHNIWQTLTKSCIQHSNPIVLISFSFYIRTLQSNSPRHLREFKYISSRILWYKSSNTWIQSLSILLKDFSFYSITCDLNGLQLNVSTLTAQLNAFKMPETYYSSSSRESLMPSISAVHKWVFGSYRGLNACNKHLYK